MLGKCISLTLGVPLPSCRSTTSDLARMTFAGWLKLVEGSQVTRSFRCVICHTKSFFKGRNFFFFFFLTFSGENKVRKHGHCQFAYQIFLSVFAPNDVVDHVG